jgi:hypothetical protein
MEIRHAGRGASLLVTPNLRQLFKKVQCNICHKMVEKLNIATDDIIVCEALRNPSESMHGHCSYILRRLDTAENHVL